MIIRPAVIVFNTLQAAFANISQNTSILELIFAGSDPTEIDDMQKWFSQNQVRVNWGWIRQPTEAGFGAVYVHVENSKEFLPYEFIGQESALVTGDTETLGNYVESNTAINCISTNANKTDYIADLVKYILFLNRISLEQNFGLQEQLLTLGPTTPETKADPDIFTFRRDVMFNCKHIDTVDIFTVGAEILRTIIIEPEVSIDATFSYKIT